jgi:hypothetical protein
MGMYLEQGRLHTTANIDYSQEEHLKGAIARLPKAEKALSDLEIEFHARMLLIRTHEMREELAHVPDRKYGPRKPLAALVTCIAASTFTLLGLPITRVSKVRAGRKGQLETGLFAQFLDEVFRIFEIDASPAGQIKLLKNSIAQGTKALEVYGIWVGRTVSITAASHAFDSLS